MCKGGRRGCFRDGRVTPPPARDLVADVLVVGGGPVGVMVAERLAAAGLDCAVLEAGRFVEEKYPSRDRAGFVRAVEPLTRVDEAAWGYRSEGHAYDWLRVRSPGGRSLLWGGWCFRIDAQNLRDARAAGVAWPFGHHDLDHHYHRVEHLLAVQELELDPRFSRIPDELGVSVAPKLAATGPCSCRGWSALDGLRRARLVHSAVVLRVVADGRGRARGVEYVDAKHGARRFASAKVVVLAASPIETARILLASNLAGPGTREGLIGEGLVDHLVASYLVLLPEPAEKGEYPTVAERAAWVPRFVNLGRRRRRDYRGGFSLELRGPTALEHLDPAAREGIGVEPSQVGQLSYYLVHAVGELLPSPARRVTLDPVARDTFGRPLPVIHFELDEEATAMSRDMHESAVAVASALAIPGSRVIPFRDPLGVAGAMHEAGTCRMGRDPKRSVTDPSGRVRGTRGLYVADASVLPTALDRPPTLTVLALALATADAIAEASTA